MPDIHCRHRRHECDGGIKVDILVSLGLAGYNTTTAEHATTLGMLAERAILLAERAKNGESRM